MANKVQPIKPSEVAKAKQETIPDEVFEAFNELITENFDGSSATVTQDDVAELMTKKGLDRNEIYKRGWLDVEEIYEKAGWKVKYDKPAYCETYAAYFVFSRRRGGRGDDD